MISYVNTRVKQIIKIDFIRFCMVGGMGFFINLSILLFLTKVFDIKVVVAQFIGAEVALFSNFILHHNWTYGNKRVKKSLVSLIVQFHAVSWPAILGSTLIVALLVSSIHMNKAEALLISSIVSLAWNFLWSKYVVWRDESIKDIQEHEE